MRLEKHIGAYLVIHFLRFLALSMLALAGYIFYHGFEMLLVYLILVSGGIYGISAIMKSLIAKSEQKVEKGITWPTQPVGGKPGKAGKQGAQPTPMAKPGRVIELKKVRDEAARKDPVVERFLNLVLNDDTLISPIYCREIKSESDIENAKGLPLIYIWNEDRQKGTFTLSVNGKMVMALLETLCDQNDPKYIYHRDEIMRLLSSRAREAVIKACQKEGRLPSEIFGGK